MDTTFGAYAAGFFDGEGWVVIGRECGKEGRSDIHHIGVYITQRARHRAVLDRFQAEFGGTVTVRATKLKGRETWAEQADWHIHTRAQIERFCRAVQPHCIVKAQQIAIALEYATGFIAAPNVRDDLGRIHGRSLCAEEIGRRERLRLALQVANERGSARTVKIERAVKHVERPATPPTANRATISRGESRYNSVLTEDAVRAIRAAHAAGGQTMESMAAQYGVSPAAIRQVVRRISWKHID